MARRSGTARIGSSQSRTSYRRSSQQHGCRRATTKSLAQRAPLQNAAGSEVASRDDDESDLDSRAAQRWHTESFGRVAFTAGELAQKFGPSNSTRLADVIILTD